MAAVVPEEEESPVMGEVMEEREPAHSEEAEAEESYAEVQR